MNYGSRGHGGAAARSLRWRLGEAAIACLMLVSVPGSAADVWRPRYHGSCDLPRAAWNEEILRMREAAQRECKNNALLQATDRSAPLRTTAQEAFARMLQDHEILVQRAR